MRCTSTARVSHTQQLLTRSGSRHKKRSLAILNKMFPRSCDWGSCTVLLAHIVNVLKPKRYPGVAANTFLSLKWTPAACDLECFQRKKIISSSSSIRNDSVWSSFDHALLCALNLHFLLRACVCMHILWGCEIYRNLKPIATFSPVRVSHLENKCVRCLFASSTLFGLTSVSVYIGNLFLHAGFNAPGVNIRLKILGQ